MRDHQMLQERWNVLCRENPTLVQMLDDKLASLFSQEDISFVRQGMELLTSFGDEALYFLLEVNDDEASIKDVYSSNMYWLEKGVVEVVSRIDSLWHPSFRRGLFSSIFYRQIGPELWADLSDPQRQILFDLSLQMVVIEPAEFWMGSREGERGTNRNEHPRHKVCLSRGYAIGKYEVTVGLWETVMLQNLGEAKKSGQPVDNVSWIDAVLFCNQLSEKQGFTGVYVVPPELLQLSRRQMQADDEIDRLTTLITQDLNANGYRLPTEAEWDYAARGKKVASLGPDEEQQEQSVPSIGTSISHTHKSEKDTEPEALDETTWYQSNSERSSSVVGQKKPNSFGLHDVAGNVWEWVWDYWDDDGDDYRNHGCLDPTGAVHGTHRVRRGGGWGSHQKNARITRRNRKPSFYRNRGLGFRICQSILDDETDVSFSTK